MGRRGPAQVGRGPAREGEGLLTPGFRKPHRVGASVPRLSKPRQNSLEQVGDAHLAVPPGAASPAPGAMQPSPGYKGCMEESFCKNVGRSSKPC